MRMPVRESTSIGYAKVELIQYTEEFWACDYNGPKIGLTLAVGNESKARAEYNKVKAFAPCQLRSYLNHKWQPKILPLGAE